MSCEGDSCARDPSDAGEAVADNASPSPAPGRVRSTKSKANITQSANIKSLHTQRELDEFVTREQSAIVEYVASWCGACKAIQPLLDELAESHSSEVAVAQVSCDKNRETKRLASANGIRSYPVFFVYENGVNVSRWDGADRGKLEKAVERLLSAGRGKRRRGGKRSMR